MSEPISDTGRTAEDIATELTELARNDSEIAARLSTIHLVEFYNRNPDLARRLEAEFLDNNEDDEGDE